jgi:hypothetical protein
VARAESDVVEHRASEELILGILYEHGHLARALAARGYPAAACERIDTMKEHFAFIGPREKCELQPKPGFAASWRPENRYDLQRLDDYMPRPRVL